MKYYYLPKEYRTVHEACLGLVNQIEDFILCKDYQFLQVTTQNLTLEEKEYLEYSANVWDFLKRYKEEQFYKLLNKQLLLGLIRDFCYFMQESLDCSNKMRLVVAYALLRRPLVDNLKILLRIVVDESFYDNFIKRDDYDPVSMKDEELKKFLNLTDHFRIAKAISGTFIYKFVYDKNNPSSIINLSNRAIHPVTTRPWNKTGAMNCNFMFVTGEDIDGLWKQYYSSLLAILMFYSELLNAAVFGLFQDEIEEGLYTKRIEQMTEIMKKGFPKNGKS